MCCRPGSNEMLYQVGCDVFSVCEGGVQNVGNYVIFDSESQ